MRATLAIPVLACIACGGEPAPRPVPRPSLLDTAAPPIAPYPTPAAWKYHPREVAPILAQVTLPDGRVVSCGKRGERWLVDPGRALAETAAENAPEDLVAMTRSSGAWLFLGRSGTSYEAREPLGPFVSSRAPLEPLVRLRVEGPILLGVRRDGALLRSDDGGAAWTRVARDQGTFEDVALRPDGRGLALSVPEALFETRDAGATFHRLDVAPFGAEVLVEGDAGELLVWTPLGARRWDPDSQTPFPMLGRTALTRARTLGAPIPLGPSADALEQGRAVLVRDAWIELRPTPSPFAWELVTGPFGGHLSAKPALAFAGCSDVRIAGWEETLYVACARMREANITQPLEFRRSVDGGKTWTTEPYFVEGQTEALRMAVGPHDELIVAGVCSTETTGAGCRPMGIQFRRAVHTDAGAATVALVPAAAQDLAGTADALVFSLDGRTAYAFGTSSKSDVYTVLVSHDGGASFDGRDVPALPAAGSEELRGNAPDPVESAATAEDGTTAFVLDSRGRRSWLVVDDDGRVVSLSRPPVDAARIGAAGGHALAIDPTSEEAWESLDAGASWSPLGKLPIDPCPEAGGCVAPPQCVWRGCVIGDAASRLGWGSAPSAFVLPPGGAGALGRAVPRVGVTYACALDPGDWRPIPGVLSPPEADHAAMGGLAWIAEVSDRRTGAVSVVQAHAGPRVGIDEVPLLAPANRGEDVAYTSSSQIEGFVALRYAVPGALGSTGSRDVELRHIEVAWDDVLAGRVGHAIIPDGGAFHAGDFDGERAGARHAHPELLSIATGGVSVRPHVGLGDDQDTFFVDGRTVETLPPVRWPDEALRHGHADVVHVGRTIVPIRLDGTAAMRARRTGDGFAFDAAALGFADPQAFGVGQYANVSYVGARSGFLVLIDGPSGARAYVHPFRAEGALFDEPVRVPTQSDLPSSPRPCSASEVATTPRVVVPYAPGARHAVIVTDPVEPLRILLTDDAVLHGTFDAPCLAAYDAGFVASEDSAVPEPVQAILPGNPLDRAYLFREAQGATDTLARVEYRTMLCHPDTVASPPPEIFRSPGTHVPRP